jgi:hypothetical protein
LNFNRRSTQAFRKSSIEETGEAPGENPASAEQPAVFNLCVRGSAGPCRPALSYRANCFEPRYFFSVSVDFDSVAGGVTTVVLDLPGSPAGPCGPGAPCGPGTGVVAGGADCGTGTGVTVVFSQALRPSKPAIIENRMEYFISFAPSGW